MDEIDIEVNKLSDSIYESQLKDKKIKSKTPLFMWFLLTFILLFIINIIFRNHIILQITAGIIGLTFFGSVIVFIFIQLRNCYKKYNLTNDSSYIVWFIFILLLPFFGALLYWFGEFLFKK
jgi:hypothetical protein